MHNRDELLKQLTILDFMSFDLDLYLNTHPNDREAIEHYNSIVIQAEKIRILYEKLYGPLCSARSMSRDTWTWIDNPWPWEKEFNFELCRGEIY